MEKYCCKTDKNDIKYTYIYVHKYTALKHQNSATVYTVQWRKSKILLY